MPVLCVSPSFPSSQECGRVLMSGDSKRELTDETRSSIRVTLEAEVSKVLLIPGLSHHVQRYEETIFKAATSSVAYFDLLEQMFNGFVQRLQQSAMSRATLPTGVVTSAGLVMPNPDLGMQLTCDQMSSVNLAHQLAGMNDMPASRAQLSKPYGSLLSSSASIWQTPMSTAGDFGPSTLGRLAALQSAHSTHTLDHLITSASSGSLSRTSSAHSPNPLLSTAHPVALSSQVRLPANPLTTQSSMCSRVLQPPQPSLPVQRVMQLSSQSYAPTYLGQVSRPKSAESLVMCPGSAYSSGELQGHIVAGVDVASDAGDGVVSESGSGVENLPVEWQMAREQLLHYQLACGDEDEDAPPPPPPQLPCGPITGPAGAYPRYSLQTMPVNTLAANQGSISPVNITLHPDSLFSVPVPQQQTPRVASAAGWSPMLSSLPMARLQQGGLQLSRHGAIMGSEACGLLQPPTHQQLVMLQPDPSGFAAVGPPVIPVTQAIHW